MDWARLRLVLTWHTCRAPMLSWQEVELATAQRDLAELEARMFAALTAAASEKKMSVVDTLCAMDEGSHPPEEEEAESEAGEEAEGEAKEGPQVRASMCVLLGLAEPRGCVEAAWLCACHGHGVLFACLVHPHPASFVSGPCLQKCICCLHEHLPILPASACCPVAPHLGSASFHLRFLPFLAQAAAGTEGKGLPKLGTRLVRMLSSTPAKAKQVSC